MFLLLFPTSFFFVLIFTDLNFYLPKKAPAIYLCLGMSFSNPWDIVNLKKCESWEKTKGCSVIMSRCHRHGIFLVKNGFPFLSCNKFAHNWPSALWDIFFFIPLILFIPTFFRLFPLLLISVLMINISEWIKNPSDLINKNKRKIISILISPVFILTIFYLPTHTCSFIHWDMFGYIHISLSFIKSHIFINLFHF